MCFRRGLAVTVLAAAFPAAAVAQEPELPRVYDNIAVAAGNVALGTLTAALSRIIRGERVDYRAITGGALGGALVLAGKGIVAENGGVTNFAGRQLAALGSSGIRNAGAGRPFLSHVSLPWGPLRFHVTTPEKRIRVKLDLATSITLAAAFFDDELNFDSQRSLASGVAIFDADTSAIAETLGGSYGGGVIQVRSQARGMVATPATIDRIIGHELVHAIQSDFLFNTLSEPLEATLLGRSAKGRIFNRYVDLGLNMPLAAALNSIIAYEKRPWEREARTLAGRK